MEGMGDEVVLGAAASCRRTAALLPGVLGLPQPALLLHPDSPSTFRV